ncbi:hypothetical protein HYE82_11865 [Streptomyces sp. BR123]|uniref:hypothetical protein n=1 Tax=Streptomyces sp. BR123 TaxID=2749828 RepID=UPI0015C47422|nr:hypothetical protein [Streptomyces sp. BR123]NXY95075.1 hypothetical protein [Streptomyces sp. BR123]
MPRGRHRNPEPLHRLLTPAAVAGVSLTTATVAWLLADPVALRLLVALAAAAGIAAAVVMRTWDRTAGRRVTELARERVKDEWKTDERIAELESDLEEARVLRAKLDAKLRAKRVELAGLRGEHAALLRRYATAETERASALEGRRLLAIEASAAPAAGPAKELPPVTEERTSSGAPTAVGYARAHAALSALMHKAEAGPAGPGGPGGPGARAPLPAPARPAQLPAGQSGSVPRQPAPTDGPQAADAATQSAGSALPARRPAGPVAPYQAARRPASRTVGGFDFFGTKGAERARAAIESVQNEDLADVVGEEALAVHKAESDRAAAAEPEPRPESDAAAAAAGPGGAGQVIDLTEHDETEPINVGRLRSAIS